MLADVADDRDRPRFASGVGVCERDMCGLTCVARHVWPDMQAQAPASDFANDFSSDFAGDFAGDVTLPVTLRVPPAGAAPRWNDSPPPTFANKDSAQEPVNGQGTREGCLRQSERRRKGDRWQSDRRQKAPGRR